MSWICKVNVASCVEMHASCVLIVNACGEDSRHPLLSLGSSWVPQHKDFFVGEAKWAGGSMSLWDGASVPECTGGHGGSIFAWLHVIVFGSADMMLHASLLETSLRGMR